MTWLGYVLIAFGVILYLLVGIFVQALLWGEYVSYEHDELERIGTAILWPLIVVALGFMWAFNLPIKLALKIREKRNK